MPPATAGTNQPIEIQVGDAVLEGALNIPPAARGVVVFAHGSGSSRFSPRNQAVASTLQEHGLGTLLFDLLTRKEEELDRETAHLRFDIPLLADRLVAVKRWLGAQPAWKQFIVGYFGASTGGGAALLAAARDPANVAAVVSRGGRPDLAPAVALRAVRAATLLVVGELDVPVIRMNETAFRELGCEKRMAIVPGATHLFEEPGTLQTAAELSADWFASHFRTQLPIPPTR